MGTVPAWTESLSSLDDSQREMLTGGGLSKRFSRLPLWLSHPANIGAFYGVLISLALLLPYYMTEEFWFELWILHASLLSLAAAFLGLMSRILNLMTKRMPMQVYRKILYPMPFVGFTLFTLIHTDLLVSNSFTQYLSWGLLIIPGPMYVHLSWAPRWRLLCMIEDGDNPFKGLPVSDNERSTEVSDMAGDDSELVEVVESFEEE
ncbi:MAG: hypothetical protein DWC02_02190 [Candidatus Poseidoniales archaeon]|nr:MAG: hypothetical protein DWC02_02190 [Candidatus Poseidoniales archaeon]